MAPRNNSAAQWLKVFYERGTSTFLDKLVLTDGGWAPYLRRYPVLSSESHFVFSNTFRC